MTQLTQLELFSLPERAIALPKKAKLKMSEATLTEWKETIFAKQTNLRNNLQPTQMSLLPSMSICLSDSLDPFSLKLHNSLFYEQPDQSTGEPCLYFVIDNTLPLLLYVGESQYSPTQRWQGKHDCKTYIQQYIELHRQYSMDTAVCTAFWWHTPADRKQRQQIEQKLIHKWHPPFNKENWRKWSKPFG